MTEYQHTQQDPRQQYPRPEYPEQDQRHQHPGFEGEMQPEPDYGYDTYRGYGRLEGKKAIITGGDSGIGRAVALAFAREGADVLISYLESEEPDAAETVACMLEDAAATRTLTPAQPEPEAIERLVRDRQPRCLSYEDWRRLDDLETARGRACGRPRVKFTRVDEMLAALGRSPGEPHHS